MLLVSDQQRHQNLTLSLNIDMTKRIMKIPLPVFNIINKTKLIMRLALAIAIASLFISCLLTLGFGQRAFDLDNEIISTFIWFSIIGSTWTCLLSIIILAICIFIYRKYDREIWHNLKREIILTLSSVASLTIFYLLALTINKI